MSKVINIKKGLNIPLEGAPSMELTKDSQVKKVAIVPEDFPGYTWKVSVKSGDKVSKGTPLLFAKEEPSLCLTSPISGIVEEVNRGERRKIMYVSVVADGESRCEEFGKPEDSTSIKAALFKSGLFAMLRQRPFDIVPFTDIPPRDIFVTAFDTAPLAGPIISQDEIPMLEAGLTALSKLTQGKVYLSIAKGSGIESRVAETIEFEGPHPAGNVGTQIAAIAPVNKGETVWTLDAETAVRIGRLIETGIPDYTTRVALTGAEMKNPHMVETIIGASLESLLKGELKTGEGKVRVISGNVLTGVMVNAQDGYLRYPYRQITAIPEGDDADEFMGWASLNPGKYSVKKTFPTFLHGLTKPFKFDARVKGGHRAMILSGEYDKVFPMDIYPEYLIKAIMAKDIERMEQLGIYEVAPEDFALPEFVDTSKLELQKLVREGLDYLRKETL